MIESVSPESLERKLRRRRVALVCGGGGITGGVYEAGACYALDGFLTGRRLVDFDIFVGCSAGSMVAAALAAGIPPRAIYQRLSSSGKLRGQARRLPELKRSDIFKVQPLLLAENLTAVTRLLGQGLLEGLIPGRERTIFDTLSALGELLPSGLLDNSSLEDWMGRLLRAVDAPLQFRDLKKELYIPALNLDTAQRVIFGEPGIDHVPIPRAVRASASIPVAYRPTLIDGQSFVDGGVERNLHLDVAVRHGAELIIAINPLVPIFNEPGAAELMEGASYIAQRGPAYILDQVFRVLVYTRMHALLERTRERNPDVEILMFQPRRSDLKMWAYNIMRYSVRSQIAEYAYEQTRQTIVADLDYYRRVFERFNIATGEVPPDASSDGRLGSAMTRLEQVAEWMERLPVLGSLLSRIPELEQF